MRYVFTLLFAILSVLLTAQSTDLYPIYEKGHWGFIYEDGKQAVRPEFHSVGDFSDGLAPVRPGGLYGYIDESGDFFLEPRYEYAEPFRNGVAKVYLAADQPMLIDRTGKDLFQNSYPEVELREEPNRVLVFSATGKQGLVDYQGKVILDTLYQDISPLINGHYMVYPSEEGLAAAGGQGDYRNVAGLMNAEGQQIIPYGLYSEIVPFGPNYWHAYPMWSSEQQERPASVVLNKEGKVLFEWPTSWVSPFEYESFNANGLAPVRIYRVDPDTLRTWSSSDRLWYATVIDSNGKPLFADRAYNEIIPYSGKRFFARDTTDQWQLIDPLGNVVHTSSFTDIHRSETNASSWMIAEIDDQNYWAFHPEEEPFQLPTLSNAHWSYWNLVGDWAYLNTEVYKRKTDSYETKTYALHLAGKRQWSPALQAIKETPWEKGLKAVILDNGNSAYVRQDFSVAYTSRPVLNLGALNVDYQMRGYCYASQKPTDPLSGFGGQGGSDNIYQYMPPAQSHEQAVRLEVVQEADLIFRNMSRGIRLRLSNQLTDTLLFPAQDARIELIMQAQDKSGTWRDIEYLPLSWCGNSYHTLVLPPNTYWNFIVPQYAGAQKTWLRAKVHYYQGDEAKYLFSDPYQAGVNPGQFWRKRVYHPQGLMDPYDE